MKQFLLRAFREIGMPTLCDGLMKSNHNFTIKMYSNMLLNELNKNESLIISKERIDELKKEFKKEKEKWNSK